MALIGLGSSRCPLCGDVLREGDDLVGFPAFLPPKHELGGFSDAAFHRSCFDADTRADAVHEVYARFRAICDARPKNLTTLAEMEQWTREAFKDFS